MNKKTLKLYLLIYISIISCNTRLGNNFEIVMDLRKEFKFSTVEMTGNDQYTKFILDDIDHTQISIDSLESYAFIVDKYLTSKFPMVDSLEVRKYLFCKGAGFEIVEFEFNENGKLVNTIEY